VRDLSGWCTKNGRAPLRFFSVVDGVTGGEGQGPFNPTPRAARVLVGGGDLLLVDAVAARLMNFAVAHLPHLARPLAVRGIDLSGVSVSSADFDVASFFDNPQDYLDFAPPAGWEHLLPQRQKVLER
jgi:hypothetical protein